jgi:hypothetical protein
LKIPIALATKRGFTAIKGSLHESALSVRHLGRSMNGLPAGMSVPPLMGARDLAREIAKTEAYQTSRYQRKKVEMLFAHLKRILKLDRLRLRGPCGARDEFHLAAVAQNLRKLAKLIPGPQTIPAT